MSALATRDAPDAHEHGGLFDRAPRRRVQWYDAVLGAALVAVVVLAATSVGASGSTAPVVRSATVQRGVVQSSVQATGNVAPAGTYSVSFGTGGTVSEIDVSPGQQVTKGQVLAKLDATQAQQQLAAATQSTTAAQARLQELEQVLTPAARNQLDLAAQQAQNGVDTSNQNLANAQQKLAADQAAHASAGELAQDQQAVDQAQNQLTQAQNQQQTTLAGNAVKEEPPQQADVAAGQASIISAQVAQANAQKTLDEMVLVAPSDGVVTAVNGTIGQTVGGGGSAAPVSSSGSSGASGASGASSGGSGGSGGTGGAAATGGASGGSSSGTGASASTSSSGVSSSGASSSSAFVTLVDVSSLDVSVGFSESDATKVQPGQPATVTFDALPGITVPGVVTSVATTSTVVSNVVTYAVNVQLTQTAAGVKPGMTASVTVITGEADNVLHVPSAAVRGTGTNATVTVLRGKKQVSTPVTVGMRGDTDDAILSGLKVGDRVVTSVSTSGSSGTTGTGTNGLTNRFGGGGGLGGGGLGGAGRGFGGGGFGGRGG